MLFKIGIQTSLCGKQDQKNSSTENHYDFAQFEIKRKEQLVECVSEE